MKIVGAIFEKLEILNFFLMWTTLNFRSRGKTKKTARDIYMRTLYIEFERDRSIGLGSMFGDGHTDGQTDRHTHTHTHRHFFLKHIFRLWGWCRMKNNKKSKSKILTIAILPSLLMSLESERKIDKENHTHAGVSKISLLFLQKKRSLQDVYWLKCEYLRSVTYYIYSTDQI